MKSLQPHKVFQYCSNHAISIAASTRGRSLGIAAVNAYERALIVLCMLLGASEWADGYERRLDDCFEMGDGDEVVSHLVVFADADKRIEDLLNKHVNTRGCLPDWRIAAAKRSAAEMLPLG